MKLTSLFLMLLTAALLLTGCRTHKPVALAYEIVPVDYRLSNENAAPGFYLMRSMNDMDKLIAALGLEPVSHEYDYSVYFGEYDLLLIYGGQKATSGYKIEALEVRGSKKSLRVIAELQSPKSGCLLAQMITYPMQLIAIPKTKSGINEAYELCNREVGC
ncbi:MAG: protease complex subunit PrcB family protein [Bacteroidia bacterium]